MSISVKYVGLDVSKSKIAVACADEGRQNQQDEENNPRETFEQSSIHARQ
jgi:hypothetical protein